MLNVNQSISLKNTTKFNSAWCHVVSQINTFFYAATTGSRSSHQRFSVKKDVLKNFTNFTGKHMCWGRARHATLLKSDSNTGVFL